MHIQSVTLIFLSFFLSKGFALYNGNPSSPMMPEKDLLLPNLLFSFKTGYEFDDVFNRKLHSSCDGEGKVKNFASSSQFGVLTWGLMDRVEVYTSLGEMSAHMKQDISDNAVRYHTHSHFAWCVGGRTLFAYWNDLQFGLAASYLHFSPSIRSISVNDAPVSPQNAQIRYREWQVGAGVSYHIWWLFPYIGIKYANARAKFFDLDSLEYLLPEEEFTLKSKKQLGLVLGCGISPERGFALNAEGRFFDETALTVSANVRF